MLDKDMALFVPFPDQSSSFRLKQHVMVNTGILRHICTNQIASFYQIDRISFNSILDRATIKHLYERFFVVVYII